jgi:hypothetical protein
MRKVFFLFLFIYPILIVQAQKNGQICRLGFSYEVSSNPHWGKEKPVIMKVYPNSPAETAGIVPNDVIEAIDGLPVAEISDDDVDSLLTASANSTIELTVRNFAHPKRTVSIVKECASNSALSESLLATAFSMYSVENTHDRLFDCPFVTTTTEQAIDFLAFKSFDFILDEDHRISKIESIISQTLKTELTKKGLRANSPNPDFLIQTYYTFNKNPNFKQKRKETEELPPVFRYDITRDRVTKFPFLPSSTPESEAEYILQLGIRFIDQRLVPGRVFWECEVNELMNAPFAIEDYAAIHIPLMCMQFPYVKYNRNAQFILSKKAYYYTGIHYNIDRLNEVVSVDPNSPAAAAGIRPNDVIEKIDHKRMDHSVAEFTEAYHQFVAHTMKFRNKATRFTNASGFTDCMYWDKLKYTQITKAFKREKYMTAFSYLYAFESYVNPLKNSSYTFHIKRGNERRKLQVRPVFYSEKTIELN